MHTYYFMCCTASVPGRCGRATSLPDETQTGRSRLSKRCAPLWARRARLFARFALDQTLESFVRGHVFAFEALGARRASCCTTTSSPSSLSATDKLVRYHPRILELAGHYHFAPQPRAPYRGNERPATSRTHPVCSPLEFARFCTTNDQCLAASTGLAAARRCVRRDGFARASGRPRGARAH
jgi:hypothetical protein